MTTKQETALAVKSRVENRVAMSGAFGTHGVHRRAVRTGLPERAAGIAGVGGMHAAVNGHSDHALHNGGVDTGRQAGGDHPIQAGGNPDTDDGRVDHAGAPGDERVVHPNAGGVRPRRLGIRGRVCGRW